MVHRSSRLGLRRRGGSRRRRLSVAVRLSLAEPLHERDDALQAKLGELLPGTQVGDDLLELLEVGGAAGEHDFGSCHGLDGNLALQQLRETKGIHGWTRPKGGRSRAAFGKTTQRFQRARCIHHLSTTTKLETRKAGFTCRTCRGQALDTHEAEGYRT